MRNATLLRIFQDAEIPYSVHPEQPSITITLFASVLPSVADGPDGPVLEAESLVLTAEPEPVNLTLSPDGAVQAMCWQDLSLPVPSPLAAATTETLPERLKTFKTLLCPAPGLAPDPAAISVFYGMPVQD